jgi:hypothetical protein
VRGTTREPAGVALIEGVGGEGVVADPDRVVTLVPALAGVGVVCVLLGSAEGSDAALSDLHGARLVMLLTRILDTPVRGFVYEASGTVDAAVLVRGGEVVSSFCSTSRIPFELVAQSLDTVRWDVWAARVADGVERVLTPPRAS